MVTPRQAYHHTLPSHASSSPFVSPPFSPLSSPIHPGENPCPAGGTVGNHTALDPCPGSVSPYLHYTVGGYV